MCIQAKTPQFNTIAIFSHLEFFGILNRLISVVVTVCTEPVFVVAAWAKTSPNSPRAMKKSVTLPPMNSVMYKIAIDKSVINDMEVVRFPGSIYVIDNPLKVVPALKVLKSNKIVGFDTETRPSFKKGVVHKVSLVQLSGEDECFLFRLNKIGFNQDLLDFLASDTPVKIGLSLHDDFSMINHSAKLKPKGFVDLQNIVGQFNISDISLQKIYAILFQKKISKGQRLSNWEANELTPAQMQYAAIDAWACTKIYQFLKDGNFDPEASPFKKYDDNEIC